MGEHTRGAGSICTLLAYRTWSSRSFLRWALIWIRVSINPIFTWRRDLRFLQYLGRVGSGWFVFFWRQPSQRSWCTATLELCLLLVDMMNGPTRCCTMNNRRELIWLVQWIWMSALNVSMVEMLRWMNEWRRSWRRKEEDWAKAGRPAMSIRKDHA